MSNLSEQEIRAIARDEIRRMIGTADSSSVDIQYLPTHKAYYALGYDSPQQLRDKVRDGLFRLSTKNKTYEVQDRRSKGSTYRRYYFNIPACIKRLNTPPEEREA